MVGATLVGLAGLNREFERGLACWMTGPKRLEVRSVYEAGSEGVGLREGPRMSSMDLDGWGTFSSSRVGLGVGVFVWESLLMYISDIRANIFSTNSRRWWSRLILGMVVGKDRHVRG
jgi:hypothetical protein